MRLRKTKEKRKEMGQRKGNNRRRRKNHWKSTRNLVPLVKKDMDKTSRGIGTNGNGKRSTHEKKNIGRGQKKSRQLTHQRRHTLSKGRGREGRGSKTEKSSCEKGEEIPRVGFVTGMRMDGIQGRTPRSVPRNQSWEWSTKSGKKPNTFSGRVRSKRKSQSTTRREPQGPATLAHSQSRTRRGEVHQRKFTGGFQCRLRPKAFK